MNPPPSMELLSAMITPAVLISASGTLILSTSTRLARVVDRVRELGRVSESLFTASGAPFAELRWSSMDQQLALVSYAVPAAWVPSALGIGGMLMLFYGCVMLLRETRLALRAVDSEMAFVLELSARHRREANGGTPPSSP